MMREKIFYSRQTCLPEIGTDGQHLLKKARILVVGAGGLGSPAALYLAAAGVGRLGIVDGDTVELSNLHRQVLHSVAFLGKPKVESAKTALSALNPNIEIQAYPIRLVEENTASIFKEYDLIVDGTDNFKTRYLINDTAFRLKKPVAHGSVLKFEGRVTLLLPDKGPCYRCLFPEPPPIEAAPSCAEAGVVGALPGVIGTLQAMETIKWILGAPGTLVGRLLLYDGLNSQFREIQTERDTQCPCHP